MEISGKIEENKFYKKTVENKYLAIFLILFIALMTYSYFTQGFVYTLANQNLEDIVTFINSFGALSWLIYTLVIVCEIVIAPIPQFIINVAGSVSFGSFNVILLTVLGSGIGNIVVYYIAKIYGHRHFENLISEKRKAIFHKYSEKYGHLVLFVLRLNPLTSNDLFSYLAGLIGIPFWKFFLSTMIGVIPTIVIVSYFGETFIKNNPLLKVLFFVITSIYIAVLVYLLLRFSKNKVKSKLENFKK